MENETIYCVKTHQEHEQYPASSSIVGVTKSKETAILIAKEEYNCLMENSFSEYNQKDLEITTNENEGFFKIFDKNGGYEYAEVCIVEKVLE